VLKSGKSTMDENTKLIGVGVTGALLSMLCCLTPLLVILLGALGLTAFVAKLDYVLVPVFVASLLLWPLRLCAGGGAAPRRPRSQPS
jgi:mercuric ion transport protein